ncbi:MAG: hypothetical protein J6Y08_07815 [Clostridiales bacterium]|nr:hypothetical protein [Clostridiales bacterium]
MEEEKAQEERAPYGYCTNCAEPFNRPYTHCPFCNKPNPHFDQDLKKSHLNNQDKLISQLQANRAWVDANRAEVLAETDARIEQNLQDMKQTLRGKGSSFKTAKPAKAAKAATAKSGGIPGILIAALILGGIALLIIGLVILL